MHISNKHVNKQIYKQTKNSVENIHFAPRCLAGGEQLKIYTALWGPDFGTTVTGY